MTRQKRQTIVFHDVELIVQRLEKMNTVLESRTIDDAIRMLATQSDEIYAHRKAKENEA